MLKQTGSVEKKVRNTPWKKIAPEKLVEFIELHPDAFLKEIAEVFGCSDTAVMKALKRLKYTRKKTTVYKEANESYQQEFIEKVSKLSKNSIVYVDETGINKYLYREVCPHKARCPHN